MVYLDQLGREIRIEKAPKRIVSLVPSQTELLCALGVSNLLVGVTKFCIHPQTIQDEKEIVGGTKKVSFEKIKKLHPDIILCNKEENTKLMVDTLEREYPVHVSDVSSLDNALELIALYGELFDKKDQANLLQSRICDEVKFFNEFISGFSKKRVAYFIWRKPWMVVGKNTYIHHILQINGFINVFGDIKRYPEISMDTLAEKDHLDVIFLSSEPYPFSEQHKEEIKTFFPNTQVILVDGEYFSWFGARLQHAFTYFKKLRNAIELEED